MKEALWRELTQTQKEEVQERFDRPHTNLDGIPYVYEVQNGKIQGRYLKGSLGGKG